MTECISFDIHDARGLMRTDFSDEEINSLSPMRRKVFFDLVESKTEMDAAEATEKEAEQALYAAVQDERAAAVALGELRQTSHVKELRKVIAARNRSLGIG